MSNESQGVVKGEAALMQSPSVSASAQSLPLSPSTSKTPELPGRLLAWLQRPAHLCGANVCVPPVCMSDELVQAGWSKCWSRRENRPYYFNRFTNQSLWEVPVLGQHDVIVSTETLPSAHDLGTTEMFHLTCCLIPHFYLYPFVWWPVGPSWAQQRRVSR